MNSNIIRRAAALTALLLSAQTFAAATLPHINSVAFTNANDGTYSAVVTGENLGSAPASVPCNACYPNEVQVANYSFDGAGSLPVNVTAWSATSVTITGIQANPGDAVTIGLFNDTVGNAAAWGGRVSAIKAAPHISKLTISGTGQDAIVTITGKGFGAAPSVVGSTTNSPYLVLTDFSPAGLGVGNFPWHAGFCGNGQCDGVEVTYTSWSDTQIVISGFGGSYGSDGWVASPSDELCVNVWSSTDTGNGASGSAAKCHRLPPAAPTE